jgi:hypothetical protein
MDPLIEYIAHSNVPWADIALKILSNTQKGETYTYSQLGAIIGPDARLEDIIPATTLMSTSPDYAFNVGGQAKIGDEWVMLTKDEFQSVIAKNPLKINGTIIDQHNTTLNFTKVRDTP